MTHPHSSLLGKILVHASVAASIAAFIGMLAASSPARAQLAPAQNDPATTSATATAAAGAAANTPAATATPPPPVVTTANRAASAPASDDDIVELNPFIVSDSQNRGYEARDSLGGTRLRTDMRDIASPTSAFTQQFLDDLMVNDVSDLATFMLSTQYDDAEDAGTGQNNIVSTNGGRPFRIRGIGASQTVDFFNITYPTDRFSTERIDQARGPNATLFGLGSPGGIVNTTTKRAMLNKPRGQVRAQVSSYNSLRSEFDYNQPIITDTLGIRVAAMKSNQETWRNNEFTDQARVFGTLRWKISNNTEVHLVGERGKIHKLAARNIIGYDGYSTWLNAGANISATANAALGIGNEGARVVFNTNDGILAYWGGKRASVVPSSANSYSDSGNNIPISDFDLVPKQTTFLGPGFGTRYRYTRALATITHSFSRDWYLELTAIRLNTRSEKSDVQLQAARSLMADPNPTTPDGLPNPHAGHPYIEYYPQHDNSNDRNDSVRAMMSYRKDLGRAGTHNFAAFLEYNSAAQDRFMSREYIVSPNAPTTPNETTGYAVAGNLIWRRTYVDLNGPSINIRAADYTQPSQNVNGLVDTSVGAHAGKVYRTAWISWPANNTQQNTNHGTSATAMWQGRFWNNRIVSTLGAAYNTRNDRTSTLWLNPATHLVEVIKGARTQPANATSFSGGIVFHATNWLTFFYNKAENSALPMFSGQVLRVEGGMDTVDASGNPLPAYMQGPHMTSDKRPPVSRGKSDDGGVKLQLFNRRVFATFTFFKTRERDSYISQNPSALNSYLTPIWDSFANPNGFSVPELPAGYGSYAALNDGSGGYTIARTQTKGLEVEITANPTDNLRIYFNYAYTLTRQYGVGQIYKTYYDRWSPLWLEYGDKPLTNGNGTIADQVAVVDRVTKSMFTYADGRELIGRTRHQASMLVNYSFTTGVFRGIAIGSNLRYSSAPVSGYWVNVDNNDIRTINQFWGSAQLTFDLRASYRRKLAFLGKSVMWQVQLNINNVFSNNGIQDQRVSNDGTMVMYRFVAPTSFSLSNTISF